MLKDESKKYAKFAKKFCSMPSKSIPMNDFFKKDFVKSLKVKESFELYGKEIQIVIIPRGLRLEEMRFGGGMMAQPWFLKNDASRVFVHEEFIDFIKKNPELEETLYKEMINHEIGHLISLSNCFKNEFDTTEAHEKLIDPREYENLKLWIKSEDIGSLEVDGLTFDKSLEICEGDNLSSNFQFYYDLREHVANYYVAQCLKKENKKDTFFTVFKETSGVIATLFLKGLDENSAAILGILKSMVTKETIKEIEKNIESLITPRIETYRSWINL